MFLKIDKKKTKKPETLCVAIYQSLKNVFIANTRCSPVQAMVVTNLTTSELHGARIDLRVVAIKSEISFDVSLVLSQLYKSRTRYYLPTPLLGQDMTQGQFLSGV